MSGMDPQEEWVSIIENFPVSVPLAYEMLAISLNSRLRLALVPVAVMNTGGAPLRRFALPGGTMPQPRVMPRAGPVFARNMVSVRATEAQRRAIRPRLQQRPGSDRCRPGRCFLVRPLSSVAAGGSPGRSAQRLQSLWPRRRGGAGRDPRTVRWAFKNRDFSGQPPPGFLKHTAAHG